MTEVFIAAVSTTQLDLNDEQLQFYKDQRMKEIIEVRAAIEQLSHFSTLNKKQKNHAAVTPIWKSLLILAKLLGFQADFYAVDRLKLPQGILIQELINSEELFNQRSYNYRSTIDRWEGQTKKYLVLMEGVIQKQISRPSIGEAKRESNSNSLSRIDSCSRFRKNNRRRFARTDEQIPICLNSRRSETRNSGESSGGGSSVYRAVSNVEMFEIDAFKWRKFVDQFKKIQQQYIMSFIRKKMAINLNFQTQKEALTDYTSRHQLKTVAGRDSIKNGETTRETMRQGKDKEDKKPLFTIEVVDRKRNIQLSDTAIYLLFLGEMLLTNAYYKIQLSKGCILNTAIHPQLRNIQAKQYEPANFVQALAKIQSVLIKIDMTVLRNYLDSHQNDLQSLETLMANLEESRRMKKDQSHQGEIQEKQNVVRQGIPKANTHRQSLIKCKRNSGKIGCGARYQKIKTEHSEQKNMRDKQKMFDCRDIQKRVTKTIRAAELKQQEYLKKIQLSKDTTKIPFTMLQQDNSCDYEPMTKEQLNALPLSHSLFKDSMNKIQAKSHMLKQFIKENRKNKTIQPLHKLSFQHFAPQPKRNKYIDSSIKTLQNSAAILKRRIKEIYIRTEQQQTINFTMSSDRDGGLDKSMGYNQVPRERQTVGVPIRKQWGGQQVFMGYSRWFRGNGGVMKKMQSGQIRRVKFR